MACGRIRASKSSDLGAHHRIDVGRSARARLIKKGCVKAIFEVASLDIEDGGGTDLQGLGDLIRVVATMQEVEDAGAGLGTSRSRASAQ